MVVYDLVCPIIGISGRHSSMTLADKCLNAGRDAQRNVT